MLIKEEVAAGMKEMYDATISKGNGDYVEEDKEEDESEDEDLSLESEVDINMVIDAAQNNEVRRVLVKNFDKSGCDDRVLEKSSWQA